MNTEKTVLNTDTGICLPHDHRSAGNGSSGSMPDRTIPRPSTTPLRRLETSEDIARSLRVALTRSDSASGHAFTVLVALVAMCFLLAAFVWWRLLT